jgi:hypothetical protein
MGHNTQPKQLAPGEAEQVYTWNVSRGPEPPAKWMAWVQAINEGEAIAKAAKAFNLKEPQKLIAVRRR